MLYSPVEAASSLHPVKFNVGRVQLSPLQLIVVLTIQTVIMKALIPAKGQFSTCKHSQQVRTRSDAVLEG